MNKYLIIGSGRVARHINHYFHLLGIPTQMWSRRSSSHETLSVEASQATKVLLLISDDQLEKFLTQFPFLRNSKTIHFSGVKVVRGISSAHPLMTFGPDLYDLETYKTIPFITENTGASFKELFPELENPNAKIPTHKKALYHALCVMMGNFLTLLWENGAQTLQDELGLPRSLLLPFLQQTAINNLNSLKNTQPTEKNSALTGPVARGDVDTIIRNIDSLTGLPERDLYYAFLNYRLASGRKIGGLPNDHLAI